MKSAAEIEERVRVLLCEELDERIRLACARLPHLCSHNYRHALDVRKTVEGAPNEYFNRSTRAPGLPVLQTIGLCMLGAETPEDWQGNICEEPVDAQRCPYFAPRLDKKSLWDEFTSQLRDPEWVQTNMPEVYSLLWALDKRPPLSLPWWTRLKFRLARLRMEQWQQVEDPARLLPSPEV